MGNISKTYIDYNVRPAMFVKEDCNRTGFDFHSLLYHTAPLVGKFSINQPLTIDSTKARFELVPDLDFDVTIENSKLFGTNMAIIHNHSAKLMLSKELPYMDNKIMPDANEFKSMDITIAEMSLREVVASMCEYKPIKTLPLHRDFRLHNILFGADYYHLIDFDFAAYDDVSMEVMGMVVDLLEHGFEYVEAFLTAYIETSNIDTYDSMASNYLLYLATSCFPYDRQASLEPQAFDNLRNERSSRLVRLYLNMDNIAKFFQNK